MVDVNDYRKLSPGQLRNYVDRFVELTLSEGGKLQGWVYTIDPVSHTIVIAKECGDEDDDDSKLIVIVMANAVKQLDVVETTKVQPDWLGDFASKRKHEYTNEELQKRRASVMEWLNKNRIPLVENPGDEAEKSENVKVIGGLVIEPPYDAQSCQGTNEIVLERIRKLINSMPNT